MTSVFSEFHSHVLEPLGAAHTIPEILGQPDLWERVHAELLKQEQPLQAFLQESLADPCREVVLTGAGSSAYIGELLQGALAQRWRRCVRAVPTTDLVTHADACFASGSPVLLVSFARSGNSPESVAALDRAEAVLRDVRHLIITCNPDGALNRHGTTGPRHVFVLPSGADDRGLAMTGSFTGMALAGLLLPELGALSEASSRIAALAESGRRILAQGDVLRRAAAMDYRRAIFLGSGPCKAAARESHLKLQELTDGRVICAYDSFLGLRHGPKAAIDPRTLLVFLYSGDEAIRPYEEDLVKEINLGEHGLFRLAVGGDEEAPEVDETLSLDSSLDPEARAIVSVLAAQILGVYRSLALGLRPDTPSPTGAISRVVKGVTIYPRK